MSKIIGKNLNFTSSAMPVMPNVFSLFPNSPTLSPSDSRTVIYSYDDLHRLVSADHPALSSLETKEETFNYDAVGNRLSDANVTGYSYDSANRLLYSKAEMTQFKKENKDDKA